MTTTVLPFNVSSDFYQNVYQFFLEKYPKILEFFKLHSEQFNFSKFYQTYFKTEFVQDLSANPSSNIENKSIARLKGDIINNIMKYLTFEILFEKMKELYGISQASYLSKRLLDGSLYLHDSSAGIIGYCLGVDFSPILEKGMPYGQLYSLPPKKPKTFINQVKEAIIELSNEFAGAIAFPTLIILYTYLYCKINGLDCQINEKEVIDDFQNLVHTLNKEMRNGIESPFTNLSFFDSYILDELLTYVFPHLVNELKDKNKFLEKIKEIQRIVMEFLCKGDPVTGAPYRFPVLTANFIKDKETGEILDKEFLELVAKNNIRGQMNIYVSNDARKFSMCCRYQPDIQDFKFDSFGNGGINIGSIKVVTINLNRVALETVELNLLFEENKSDKEIFIEILKNRMNEAKQILDAFRECLRDNIQKGIYRFFKLGWFDLDKHFYSTIGFIGLYEAMQTLGYDIIDNFVIEVLQVMDEQIREFNKNSKWKYNLEQVPGESLASLFPKLDKYFYGEKLVPYVLYANQFVPLYIRHSILDKIEIEGKFFKYLSGGGISHINILHEMTSEEVKYLITLCAEKGLEHFALNPVYSICENNHYLLGKYEKCYICNGKIIDNLTRVVGFFTKVSTWTKERREWEFNRRIWNKFLK